MCNKKRLLQLIPLSIFWVVWNERNLRAFEGIEKDFISISNTLFHTFGYMILGLSLII